MKFLLLALALTGSGCVAYEAGRVDLSPSSNAVCPANYRLIVEDGQEWCIRLVVGGRIIRRRAEVRLS